MIQPLFDFPDLENIAYSFIFKYSIDINSKTETLYEVNQNNYIFKNNIGYCLTTILNKYNLIIDCISKYTNLIKSLNIKNDKNFADELLKILTEYLPNELKQILPYTYYLFYQEIYIFTDYIYRIIPKYYDLLSKEIESRKTLEKQILTKLNNTKYVHPLSELENQFKILADIEFYRNESLNYLNNYLIQMKKLKNKLDNTFLEDEYATTSHTKFFIASNLEVPMATIDFNNELKSKIINYNYSFNTLSEFFNIAIYHIVLSGKIITKCKFCNYYFIPKKNNEIYCYKNYGTKQSCKNLGKQNRYKYKQNSSKIPYKAYYKNIHDRLSKPKYKLEYLEDFDKNYKKLFKKNIPDEKQAQILINYLIKYDKKFQKDHPILKGPSYRTQKYWKYYKP